MKWNYLLFLPATALFQVGLDILSVGTGISGIKNKFQAALDRPLSNEDKKTMPYVGVAYLLVFFVTLCPFIGKTFAGSRSNYQIVDSNEIVVRKYGFEVILAKYDSKTRKFTGDYRYTEIEGSLPFKVVHIKNLNR